MTNIEILKKRLPELHILESLIQQNQDFIRSEILATIHIKNQQLPLYCLEIGNKSPDAPGIGLFGGIHGVERIGSEILLAFLHTLIERYRWDSEFRELLDNVYILMMPIVNPGGMWLKTRSNPNGVDLMRNAPGISSEKTTFLVGGQRISRWLPWYRGKVTDKMETESHALTEVVARKLLNRPLSITLDCHSGYGQRDRIWFLHANTKKPFPHLPEIYALKTLFEKTYPYHDYYTIEPQSKNYTTQGDLWDYLFQQSTQKPKGIFLPLTLELGSLLWVKKNPQQALQFGGYFNPIKPTRKRGILRRHFILLDFLTRATRNYKNWLTAYSDVSQVPNTVIRHWYRDESPAPSSSSPMWVFLRGLIRESRHWGRFPEMFKSRFPEYPIHLQDLPGTGKLNHEGTPKTIPEILDVLHDEIKEKGITPPYNLVAISMGAMLVMEWLNKWPAEIEKAVLINSSVRNYNPFYERLRPDNYWRIFRSLIINRNPVTREKAIFRMTSNLVKDPEPVVKNWIKYARERPVSFGNSINQLSAATRYKVRTVPPQIPILLLTSAKDRLVNPNCSIQISKHWNAQLKIHPEAGHDLPLDDPQWVLNSIADWLEELVYKPESMSK